MTKCLNEEKTRSATNSEMFQRLNHITHQLYEAELLERESEHRKPMIVGFFIQQFAKQRMLELYYKFFRKFCDHDKYEELDMDTDSLNLALLEERLEDVIRPGKRNELIELRSGDCTDTFNANATDFFFPRRYCNTHKNYD